MRQIFALIALGLLSVCLAACGGTSKDVGSTPTTTATTVANSTTPSNTAPAPAETKADNDKDNDLGAPHDDTSNSVMSFGHAASASDKLAITTLMKRYYAAADSEDGTKACSMIYSTLEEAVPEDYGLSPPGPAYMRGTTCPAVVTLLFKHFRPQIAAEYPKLKVARVRLLEHHGIVILNFGTMPERQFPVAREGHTWKVEALLDSEVS